MADNTGISLRAEMDAFTVKALLTLNGGGAVALLAFAPAIMNKDRYLELLDAAFVGIIFFVVGLASAVVHNICRRRCSLHYEQNQMKPPKGRVLCISLWEPGICAVSTVFKWLSLLLFMVGSLLVSLTGVFGMSLW